MAPKIAPLTTPYTLPFKAAVVTHMGMAAIPSAPPTMCDTMLNISSPFEYWGSPLSLSFVLFVKSLPFRLHEWYYYNTILINNKIILIFSIQLSIIKFTKILGVVFCRE